MVSYLDPLQATKVLDRVSNKRKRAEIVANLNSELGEKVAFLSGLAPNTAGKIMDINYIEVELGATLAQINKRVTAYEKKTGKTPAILVVNEGVLIGEIPHYAFISLPKSKKDSLQKQIRTLPTIHHAEKTENVMKKIQSHPHKRVVVLDDEGSILGIIYSDDIISMLQKQVSTGLYDFAGVHDEEDIFDSVRVKVRRRYKWLIINLATAYLAAWVVSLFEPTISKFVVLAAYMPIVAGMGGNAATQTLAVMVRSLAMGEISFKNCAPAIANEAGAGLVNGAINGAIIALIAVVWNQSPMLGVVAGTAMVVNLIVAGFFGALVPIIMKSLGKDPAASATIFITTATDVLGFLTFLGLATVLL